MYFNIFDFAWIKGRFIAGLLLASLVSFLVGCDRQQANETPGGLAGELVIFHAGSLAVPFEQLAEDFTRRHPKVRVLREIAGSRECARKVCDLGKRCDVLASADSKVIKNLLVPKYTDWYIEFANNEMVVVYSSRVAQGLTVQSLPQELLKSDAIGRADPDLDPCGYRTLMVWQLMESYYQLPGLYEKLLEICPEEKTRPKETDLLALFESGQLDFFFIYRSVAQQHGLAYLELPDEVNLSEPDRAQMYANAKVQVSGKTPGSVMTRFGEPIVYGITIPKNADRADLAQGFVRFVLSSSGQAIMKANGQGRLLNIVPEDSPEVATIMSDLQEVR